MRDAILVLACNTGSREELEEEEATIECSLKSGVSLDLGSYFVHCVKQSSTWTHTWQVD